MQKIKDLVYYNRKEIITVLLCFIIFGSILLFNNNETKDVIISNDDINISKEESIEKIIVDIKGEVNNPGTYEFNFGDRINDAIKKAGGLTSKANTNDINLSEKLLDEMLIIIPNKEDDKVEIKETIIEENKTEKKSISDNNNIIKKSNNTKTTTLNDNKISINSASVSELMTIKGIGEIKAKSIVEYRTKNGLFKSIEDITKVSGIGNSTFDKIKDYIKV